MRNESHKSMMVISIIIIPILFSCASTQQKQSEPKDADFYFNRGVSYDEQGQFAWAISDYTKALEINPKLASAYYNRARAYYFKKEYDKSWDDIKKTQDSGYKIPAEFLEGLRKASRREK
jgi:tetratricopeptide (TPR) repeat protein